MLTASSLPLAAVLDMGFAPERVDWALYSTKNAGLQPALDHLEANQDNPVATDYKSTVASAESLAAGHGHDVSAFRVPEPSD